MEKKPDEMNEEELARFYEDRKGDLSLWSKKPRQIRRRRGEGPSTTFAVRFTPTELSELQSAAALLDTNLSDFIRSASLAVARKEPVGGNVAQLRRTLLETQKKLRSMRASLDLAEQGIEKVS